MKNIDVFIVDDHALFRKGLSYALSSADHIGNIYEAANGKEFLMALEDNTPDVVLMDISMPGMDGPEATRRALQKYPDLKIIALSMHDDMEHFKLMIDAGVMGFLSKDADLEDVLEAIHTVANGHKVFSQELMYDLVKELSTSRQKTELLTEREKEVLFLISSGLSNQQIADKLHLSKRTVDKHRENILHKTQSKNTAELIMFAIRNGLI
jgi:DNA-binding NarL/FixJ family response regulator